MKFIISIIVALSLLSCGEEQYYFKKSITKSDKIYLTKNDSLIKKFSGKSNWYKQYWNGDLLIRKNKNSIDIKQIGEWRQTSKDGKELYTITNFDRFGYVIDEKILGDDRKPPIAETHCKKDTLNGQVRLICDYLNRYNTGQIKEKGKKIIANDKAKMEGAWEYYSEAGKLEKIIKYKNGKLVQ
jgi:hypothetical protein